jgi:hypothetical protein
MGSGTILYIGLFIALFPALWILAAVLDHFLPATITHHSPQRERERRRRELDSI